MSNWRGFPTAGSQDLLHLCMSSDLNNWPSPVSCFLLLWTTWSGDQLLTVLWVPPWTWRAAFLKARAQTPLASVTRAGEAWAGGRGYLLLSPGRISELLRGVLRLDSPLGECGHVPSSFAMSHPKFWKKMRFGSCSPS